MRKKKDNEGAILVAVIVILALLSLIGTMAVMSANMEMKISSNERDYKVALYAADAGLEEARWQLRNDHEESGTSYGWSDELAVYTPSSAYLDNYSPTNEIRYRVFIRDNNDGDGDSTRDSDDTIIVRVIGYGKINAGDPSRESQVIIEAVVRASAAPGPRKYIAQEGAGSAKHSSTEDLGPVNTSTSITI